MRSPIIRPLTGMVLATCAIFVVLAVNESWLLPSSTAESVEYLEAATSLVTNGTFDVMNVHWETEEGTSALVHYPPGFSLLLSVPMRLGVKPFGAALWTIAIGAGLATFMAFLLASEVGGTLAGALTAFAYMLTSALAQHHTVIWSESFFLAAVLGTVYVMLRWPDRAWLYGLLAALAVTLQYVGVGLAVVAMVWAYRNRAGRRARTLSASVAALPTLVFLGVWVRPWSDGGGSHLNGSIDVVGALAATTRTIDSMLSPWAGSTSGTLRLAIFMGALLAVVAVVVTSGGEFWRSGQRPRFLALITMVSGGQLLGTSVAAGLFSAAKGPSPDSLVVVVFLVAVTLNIALAEHLRTRRPPVQAALVTVLVMWAGVATSQVGSSVIAYNEDGLFYSHSAWMSSPIVHWLDNSARPYPDLYANDPHFVKYQSMRHARGLPLGDDDFDRFLVVFQSRPSALLFVNPSPADLQVVEKFERWLSLKRVVDDAKGVVLVPASTPPD